MGKNNVIKLNTKINVNEDVVLLNNLQQILNMIVKKHGAHATLDLLPSLVQTSQQQMLIEKKFSSKQHKAVSNG